ncbi:hypothetical protein LCGC14_1449730 [marine sediment metagenome]|uniref:Uncharacterized protein n=1 Tax=marine sediment metagenome TaxID=412755 RepID=A0A0F9LYS6_9ZZZZ
MIKALGMRSRALKPEWMWKVRWLSFIIIGGISLYGAYVLLVINANQPGVVPGMISGILLVYGVQLIYIMIEYAIKRIRLGRKVKRFYEK